VTCRGGYSGAEDSRVAAPSLGPFVLCGAEIEAQNLIDRVNSNALPWPNAKEAAHLRAAKSWEVAGSRAMGQLTASVLGSRQRN
jgi:hypothetical protein